MTRIRFVLAALLVFAASCTSPLATLKTGSSSLPDLKAGETRLVFHLSKDTRAAAPYSVSDVSYLVVQMHSQYDMGSKFATATVTGGVAAVTIPGLIAGKWEIVVSCYDWNGITGTPWAGSPDATQPFLFYAGVDELQVTPGTSHAVSILLYKPGSISAVNLTEAIPVNDVTIAPVAPLVSIPTNVASFSSSFTVAATAWNVLNTVPASDQRFTWYSDDPSVAAVDNAGNVFPKNPGTTKITAVSVESEKFGTYKSAQFMLTVDVPVAGYWRVVPTPAGAMPTSFLRIYTAQDGSLRFEAVNNITGPMTSTTFATPFSSTKVRGDVTGSGGSYNLNAKEVLDLNGNAGTLSATFNQWVSATPMSYGYTFNGSNQLMQTTPPVTYERVSTYVPVSSVNVQTPVGSVYTDTNILVGQYNNGTGAEPTIPAIVWGSSANFAQLNASFPLLSWGVANGVPGIPLAALTGQVYFAAGTTTIHMVSLDFEPTYRTANTVVPGGFPLHASFTPTIAGTAPAATAMTAAYWKTTVANGVSAKVWAVPTPIYGNFASSAPTWSSTNSGSITVSGGVSGTVSWVNAGTSNITVSSISPPWTSAPVNFTAQ